MLTRTIVIALTVCAATAAFAGGEPADGGMQPVPDVEFLNQIPKPGTVFVHQWSEGLPADVVAAEKSTENYGLLLEVESPVPVPLSECIELALKNNTGLRIERLGPLGAAAEVRAARSIFDPMLFADVVRDREVVPSTTPLFGGGSASLYTQNFSVSTGIRKVLLTGGQLEIKWINNKLKTNPSIANTLLPRYTTELGVSLNQPLLRDFGWRYSLLLVEVAQTGEEAAYYEYKAGIASLVANVEVAYWGLVLAIQSVRVQEQGLAEAQELERQNQGKFEVGALPRTAVLEAKTEVARRESLLIRSRNQRDIARDNLRALINYRSAEAGELLMIDPQDRPEVVPYEVDLDRSLQTALGQRPELLAARLQVRGSGLERKAAENQLLPRVNLIGGIGVNGLSGRDANVDFQGEPVPVNPSLIGSYGNALEFLSDGRYYQYSIGATIEIPIDNAQAKAEYAKANVGLQQAELTLQQLNESVTLEIKTAVSNLQSDLKSIQATRIARELAEENLSNQQARYDVGLATTKDLLDYQNRLTLSRYSEIEALTSYNTNLAELRRVEGTLLEARNIRVERASPEGPSWWARF